MISVDLPASFQWNDINRQWAINYLKSKQALLNPFISELAIDVENLQEQTFINLCQHLESCAEGREIRNKMFKAWRSKKSRDNDDGKKLYTFNMSVKAGEQLKKIAKNAPLNKTLEALIFLEQNSQQEKTQLQERVSELEKQNMQLKQQLRNAHMNLSSDDTQSETLLEQDMDIQSLAKLEKSQLVKKILLLQRQVK